MNRQSFVRLLLGGWSSLPPAIAEAGDHFVTTTMSAVTRISLATAVLLGLAAGSSRANLVVNGGFETGDFSGWTVVPAAQGSVIFVADDSAPYDFPPHSGLYFAVFGGYSPGVL